MRLFAFGLACLFVVSSASAQPGEFSRMMMRRLYDNAMKDVSGVKTGIKDYVAADSVEFRSIDWAPTWRDKLTITASSSWAHINFDGFVTKGSKQLDLVCEAWINPTQRKVMISVSACKQTGDRSILGGLQDETEIPY